MFILTVFLTNSILMHCYYAFSLDQMLLFIEIYFTQKHNTGKKITWSLGIISQTLSNFFTSIVFYLQIIGFITLFQGYQKVHISYLSIHAKR